MQDSGRASGAVSGGDAFPPVLLVVRLTLPDKPVREFSYDFRQDVISLGRDPSNDIQVPLTTVSRRHAQIFFEQGDYFLEDLGSTHGTLHNGRRLAAGERRLLRDGDLIEIMSFAITFKCTSSSLLDRQPGEKTEALARRMVQEVLSSLDGSKADLPALRVMNGSDEGVRYELREQQTEVVMGRSPECDLPINDQNISRRHCLVKRSWHGFTAQDLGSKNGVLVNDVRIDGPKMLKDGDEIQIGGTKIVFIDPPSRLLAQMGGLPGETSDVIEGEHASGQEEGLEEDEANEGASDDAGYGASDPHPELDVEPPSSSAEDDPDLEPVEENEEMRAAREALEKVQKRSVLVDVVVLVVGLMILFGALAFVLLFFL